MCRNKDDFGEIATSLVNTCGIVHGQTISFWFLKVIYPSESGLSLLPDITSFSPPCFQGFFHEAAPCPGVA